MNEKLLSLLGIARRAGRLSIGFDAAAESMKKGRSYLLLLADDISERTLGSIISKAEQSGTEILKINISMEQIGNALGKKMTGIISVNDSGFAEKLKALFSEQQTGGMY